MRRLEEDKNFFNSIVEKSIIQKNSILYKVSSYAGKGTMQSFKVMPGVEVIYNDISLHEPIRKTLNLNVDCVEITYCLKGQVEVEFKNQKYAYLADGDVCLFGYKTEAVSCDFSLKPFTGITVMIYLPDIIESLNGVLGTDEFKKHNFFKAVFFSDSCIINHANQGIEHIFKELFVLPEQYKSYLMKIKVIELLLYLMSDMDYKKSEAVYFSKSSVDKVKEARRIIINNMDKHITVREISKMVDMNATDLEKGFKSVYGSTIFAYSKLSKMKRAKELLSDKRLSVLEASLACGYASGGKFAKVFKEAFGITPTQYRKELK